MTNPKTVLAEALGFVVLLPACIAHAWTEPTYPSIKPLPFGPESFARPKVDQWKWNWLNHWYANSEDGVSGQHAVIDTEPFIYAQSFPKWMPKWAIAYAWSAWRNGANNLKRPLRTDGLNQPWRPT